MDSGKGRRSLKKWIAAAAVAAVLAGGAAVGNQAVPAWEEMWTKAALYEKQDLENEYQKQEEREDGSCETGQADAVPAEEEQDISLYAGSAVLMDGDSGRILYGKNENEIRPMASTTKIMTCILALESGHGDDIVTISQNAASQPQVHLGAPSGRQFYLKDLLYSLMLESHNDTAVAIAEHIGGSTEGFAEMMNQKARDIGCTDTFFITPNGLDEKVTISNGEEKAHSTTASDLARIMRYCISQSPKKEEFLEITGTSAYSFSDIEGKGSYSCVNHNAFLTMMEGAFSGKTGFTSGAGYCYVGALKDGKRNFIIALLGCGWPPHKTYKWADARELFRYGLDNYQYRNVWKEIEIPSVTVKDGIPEDYDLSHAVEIEAEVSLSSGEKRGLYLLLKEGEEPKISLRMKKELEAPVYKGDTAGWIEYSMEGETAAVYPVVAAEGAEKINFLWCAERIWDLFLE